MATRDEVFPSRFLKHSDLNGKPLTLTIKSAPTEPLKGVNGEEQDKTVLHFKETKKTLPLNVTNWDAVADVTAEADTNDWAGHRIQAYPSTTPMRGEIVDCVRIRSPEQLALPAKKKAAASKKKTTVKDDLDDEIPFFDGDKD